MDNAVAADQRQATVQANLGLVYHLARQLCRTGAIQADFDELVSAGTIGLMGAVDAFDPERGVAFSTFAAPRIRGAIQDELRRMDHLPRSVRRRTREYSRARDELLRVLGRAPEPRELADHLEIDLETLWSWKAEAESIHRISLLDSGPDSEGRNVRLVDTIAGSADAEVEERLNVQQEAEHLRDALLRLKEQERTVLMLYYFEGLKLHQIAQVLELTEGRISQIRSKALSKLRGELAPLRREAA
jgi:RNA polymerase sigma factor for flagellar operon FliA